MYFYRTSNEAVRNHPRYSAAAFIVVVFTLAVVTGNFAFGQCSQPSFTGRSDALNYARADMAAALLHNGKVLVVGGARPNDVGNQKAELMTKLPAAGVPSIFPMPSLEPVLR